MKGFLWQILGLQKAEKYQEKKLCFSLKMKFKSKHINSVSKFSKCLKVDLGVPQTDVMNFVMTFLSLHLWN